ncbi:MAG: uncharacterized protein KVP18_001800 [Porospora cf. gigantea A]|uniref:uncharacterized protein n=1 Tax=Porospora cf. gigantea A TaxID=2853593 RepID=UPI0035598826|nr:MAG: hypothetical protein KVP18_001800 [Porospora cf. gigantea A]
MNRATSPKVTTAPRAELVYAANTPMKYSSRCRRRRYTTRVDFCLISVSSARAYKEENVANRSPYKA